jgi:hypothetical protein
MNITITAQKPVSEFLKVAQELVTEVQEWAKVLWVRVLGCRPQFVSKKVIKNQMTPFPFEQLKQEVVSRFNEAAWQHLLEWSTELTEKNDNWFLSKIAPSGRLEFRAFYERLQALEVAVATNDHTKEKAFRLSVITPEEMVARKARAAMFLP